MLARGGARAGRRQPGLPRGTASITLRTPGGGRAWCRAVLVLAVTSGSARRTGPARGRSGSSYRCTSPRRRATARCAPRISPRAARRCSPRPCSSGRRACAPAPTGGAHLQRVAQRDRGAQLLPAGHRRRRADHPPAHRDGGPSVHLRSGRGVGQVGRVLGGQPHHRAAVHEHQAGPAAARQDADHLLRVRQRRLPGGGSSGFGCDNAVDNNPTSLFTDPEFIKLNPRAWNIGGTEYEIPDVMSGNSDMTWTTTSWIAANKDAAGFLAGQFDPWGMHLNTTYLGQKYPDDGITPSDPYLPMSSQYIPVTPLSNVVLYQSENQPPGNRTPGTRSARPTPRWLRRSSASGTCGRSSTRRTRGRSCSPRPRSRTPPGSSSADGQRDGGRSQGHDRQPGRHHAAGQRDQEGPGRLPAHDGDLRGGADRRDPRPRRPRSRSSSTTSRIRASSPGPSQAS